ncbi:snRNA-activating protein complex subunit 4 [Orchesella cincta]|uniref:snRNA-activating protein complex subunit 4 n=1 Tax=Orchesella cincta TaxID=48709 RepID=A0A1D2MU69_ORCCI|nr:snRNA-activating protein complex subunit 4 [Orchesella cincta]
MAPARRSSRVKKKKIILDMGYEDEKSLKSPNVVAPTRKKQETITERLPAVPRVEKSKIQMKPKRRKPLIGGADKQALMQDVVQRVISNASVKREAVAKVQMGVPVTVVKSKRGRKPKMVGVVTDEQASSQVVLQQQQQPASNVDLDVPKRKATGSYRFSREELEERVYQEQLQKLSAVNEALLLSNVQQHGGSDDESIDGDDGMLDESDEEDVLVPLMKEDDPTCPRPAPRKGRGGHKYLKRNMDALVSQEEVQGMCRILSNAMRTSLSGSIAGIFGSSPLDTDNAECDAPSFMDVIENESGVAIYRKLRRTLTVQDDWLKKKLSSYSSNPEKFKESQMHHLKGISFEHQIYLEHLCCLTVLAKQPNPAIIENGMLSWFPKFERSFQILFPELMKYAAGDSDSRTLVHKCLYVMTLKTTTTLGEVLESLNSAREKLKQLIELVDAVSHNKRLNCVDFEQIHDALQLRHVKFDESSIWGIKPIRLALEPPYFKTDDGLLAAPLIQNPIRQIKEYSMCFFKRDKQKWTTKDLQQLKACIKETLYSKRMCALYDRYEVLLADCISQYELDMKKDGRLDAPPLETKRKRGRPKKSEMELTEKYGVIYPVIAVLPSGAVVRSRVSPRLLSDWRTVEEKKLKTKSYDELVFMENDNIDWDSVAVKMVLKSRKHRNAEDCELAFRHEIHPLVNDKRWGVEESRRLKEIYTRQGNDWPAVADELRALTPISNNRTARTAYQCFFRVRNRLEPPKKLAWNDPLDQQILDNLKKHPGNWRLVAAKIDDPGSTKRQVIERYKKTINPVLRNGAFTRVEDCLLILTIEKLKPFLAKEGHFGCLVAYLPWRCETTWRDRANNLFSDWIVPWTLEEDHMLLELAITMNRNWQKISEEFTSFKNRKGCLTRYKILKRRLKDERFNNSLEAYHEAYAMTRYNVFQYKHLKEILQLLTRVKDNPLPKEHMNFSGLLRDREPSEVRLQHMLLTFDKDILTSVIGSLSRYVETRDHYWENWIALHGKRKRTFDRRTFHPDNPQSVASALHIRGLVLRKKEDIPNINDFEDEIYKFYGRFKRTKPLNAKTDRPYIPDAKTLAEWSTVSRLIGTPLDELEDVPVKKKWKALKSEDAEPPSRKRGTARAKKVIKKQKVVRPVVKTKRRGRRPRTTVKKEAVKTTTQECIPPENTDPGYILIPPLERSIRGRVRSQMKDADPEFVAVLKTLKTEPSDEKPGESGLRRSSRGITRKWSYINEDVDYDDSEVEDFES